MTGAARVMTDRILDGSGNAVFSVFEAMAAWKLIRPRDQGKPKLDPLNGIDLKRVLEENPTRSARKGVAGRKYLSDSATLLLTGCAVSYKINGLLTGAFFASLA